MKISVEKYLNGIEEIYRAQPGYKLGHDGSDGLCDCIGMCRGALERNGVSTSHLRGTNDAARNKIQNLHPISSASGLKLGDVLLKKRDADDPDYPLPAKYHQGGSAYNGDLTNYIHIGTVTGVNPLEITHMTSPSAKKDKKLGNWCFAGELPYVNYGGEESMSAEKATTYAKSGGTVNLRRKQDTGSALVDRIPVGETVTVTSHGEKWCEVTWKGKTGYLMTEFLIFGEYVPGDDSGNDGETVTIRKTDLYEIIDKLSVLVGGVG